mmetsp:Transcript_42311/g.67791  ORF Transcript_42311/g.67791 Transcript_42311/m.67791 type:complete len:114 (-) Transcript_42311:2279-2620(-)
MRISFVFPSVSGSEMYPVLLVRLPSVHLVGTPRASITLNLSYVGLLFVITVRVTWTVDVLFLISQQLLLRSDLMIGIVRLIKRILSHHVLLLNVFNNLSLASVKLMWRGIAGR